jgi:hypothetical protein
MQKFTVDVVDYKENEDGSALVQLEMCETAKSILIAAGFISMLQQNISAIGDTDGIQEET